MSQPQWKLIAASISLRALCGGVDAKVVNHIRVRGHGQVILKVTVAEVQRTVIKQLGINLNGSAGVGSAVVNSNNTNPLSVNWPL
jgi:pilus assembly protein CpaC